MSTLVIQIYKRSDGLFDWRAVRNDKDIVATSGGQGYANRSDCAATLDNFIDSLAQGQFTIEDE